MSVLDLFITYLSTHRSHAKLDISQIKLDTLLSKPDDFEIKLNMIEASFFGPQAADIEVVAWRVLKRSL